MRIALVSCAKNKRRGRHEAKELYVSPLFTFALQYASRNFDRTFILSAKHGLLDPRKCIRNYDVTLNLMSICERKRWSLKVTKQIRQKVGKDDELHYFCGRRYREFIVELLNEYRCFAPLAGLGIGRQMQWYKSKV